MKWSLTAAAKKMANETAGPVSHKVARGRGLEPVRVVWSLLHRCRLLVAAITAAALVLVVFLHLASAYAKRQPQAELNSFSDHLREIHCNPANSELEECFVNTPGESPCNHGGSLAALPDGSLLCTWYAASSEAAPDAQILCSRLGKGARQWSRPEAVVRARAPVEGCWFANKSLGDTVLFLDRDGYLWLFFAGVSIGGWTGSHVDFVVSRDLGTSWSPVRRLIGGLGNSPRSKLLELADGRLMMPLSAWAFRWQGYTVSLSLGDGQIKEKSSAVTIPGPENSQPSLLTLDDNRVVAYLRNPRGGALLFAKWDVASRKWSDARPLNLPSPDSPVDVVRCDGGVLVVYTSDKRHRLCMSLAWAADGEHFLPLGSLGDEPNVSTSYPTIVRSADGDYHLIYTYGRRATIKYLHVPSRWVEARLKLVRMTNDK